MKKKILYVLLIVFPFALTMCDKDPEVINTNFTLDSPSAYFDGNSISVPSVGDTFSINVATESATNKWKVKCPVDDIWLTYKKIGDRLRITVDSNFTANVRNSHITIVYGENEKEIPLSQDYIRILYLHETQKDFGASSGTYQILYTSNINIENLTCTPDASSSSWITNIQVEEGYISFKLSKNHSITSIREGLLTLAGDGESVIFSIRQLPSTGSSYIISLENLDWNQSWVYDVMEGSKKIGEICREYIYKYDPVNSLSVVKQQLIVAYTVKDGIVNYSEGFVLNNGGYLVWNSSIDGNTSGSEMITHYTPGSLTQTPTTIYLPDGATKFSEVELPEEDIPYATNATLAPMKLVDTKSGPENSAGQTSETYTYGVVKIVKDYWINSNYASSRYADGNNITTSQSNTGWRTNNSGACLVSGYVTGSSVVGGTWTDANDQAELAVATRNIYGCIYNWMACTNSVIEMGQTTVTPGTQDAISPQGWTIPSKEDFLILRNYITQASSNPTKELLYELYSDEELDLLESKNVFTPTFDKQDCNITGFNARGYRQRSWKSGGYNNYNYYWSLDYSFDNDKGNELNSSSEVSSSGHVITVLNLLKINTTYPMNLLPNPCGFSGYLRLIKK
ncbi:MAG: FISUMP domain-containing protein [Bacteroidales bacterium]|nr:FISUMP domain-containing protein [Bacteroidales bacterium]MDD3989690.1 FISUMP domain-containing protein [Bacteroidales bacterium]MDD4638198.1 FISUMP domain-containing protein [Bacteroidales bacterium]